MISTKGLVLLGGKGNKHEPGYAVPKTFTRGEIAYEFDVTSPPWADVGWGMLLLAKHPGRKDPFLSRWSGPRRPTADMEKWFLASAIRGSERFFASLASGAPPEQAQTVAQNSHVQDQQAAKAVVLNSKTGHGMSVPWLPRLLGRKP